MKRWSNNGEIENPKIDGDFAWLMEASDRTKEKS